MRQPRGQDFHRHAVGTRKHVGRRTICRMMLAIGSGLALPGFAAEPAVEVIVSPEHQNVKLNRRALMSMFLGRTTQWPDGHLIRVFVLPDDHPLHMAFCRQRLGTFPYVLRSAWDKRVYTGTGFYPHTVLDEQEMRRRVESTPGAIGYDWPQSENDDQASRELGQRAQGKVR